MTCLEAYASNDAPFEKVVETINPTRTAGRHPFFDVMFVMNNIGPESLELDEIQTLPVDLPIDCTKFDITFTTNSRSDGLEICLDYRRAFFTEHRVGYLWPQKNAWCSAGRWPVHAW
jgi:non-ribosomal peptide synthetase component F